MSKTLSAPHLDSGGFGPWTGKLAVTCQRALEVVSYGVSGNVCVFGACRFSAAGWSDDGAGPDRQFPEARERVVGEDEEDGVRKGIIVAMAGLTLLAGCDVGNKAGAPKTPPKPKWQYQIAFDAPPAKLNPTGVTMPAVKYTAANPNELQTRATLVVRFDASELTKKKDDANDGPMMNKMIMGPVDIRTAEGTLPADYMEAASKGLSQFLGAYCVQGKIKISVALARSSLTNRAGDAEVDNKRLSDWQTTDVEFKNPHPKC